MTIKELIIELKKHENQNANISIVCGDEDKNIIDTYNFEIHALDVNEYVELFVYYSK